MEYLEESWGFVALKTMSDKLNRTKNAVELKAKKLGLGSLYRAEMLSANQVAKMIGVDTHTVTDYWIRKCKLKSKKRAMKKQEMWLIDLSDLVKWLKKNKDKWNTRKLELYALGEEPKWLKEKRVKDLEIPIKRHHKWTKHEEEHVIYWYDRKTQKEIAKELGRTEGAIQRRVSRLKEKGLIHKNVLIRWTDKETEMLMEMDKKGILDSEIAWQLGRDPHHIRDHRRNLRDRGLYGYKIDFTREYKTEEMFKLKEKGLNNKQIAKELDLHPSTIYRRFKEV